MEQQNDVNLLQDIEQDIYLEPASAGLRFVNYLVDIILFYIVIFLGIGSFMIAAVYNGENINDNVFVKDTGNAVFIQYGLSIAMYIVFYTLLEGITKGKSLGKLITGTRAIQTDGNKITWKNALLRTLCRLVPFEPFSAFGGYPWHDTWTNTSVVKERK